MDEKAALKLLSELWQDFSDPDFIWQVVALAVSLGVAWALAKFWQRREVGGVGRLHSVGKRLVFPLAALVLVATVRHGLKSHIHVNLLTVAMPLLSSMAIVRGTVYVLRNSFPAASWLRASERWLAAVVWGCLALYITDLAPDVIDALESVSFAVGKQQIDLWMILHGLVTVFATVVIALWIAGAIETRLMGVSGFDSSLRIVLVRLTKALLTLLAIVISLSLVGIDMTALSVFTGALGVGLGFGLQKIASNYVSGFIILLDRSIRLGNMVQVDASTGGQVTQITTRFTVLRNLAGIEFIVPNETLVGNIVQNQSFTDTRVRVATTVGVSYDTDIEEAIRIMEEAARARPRVLAEPAPKALLVQFADSSINLELGFWIADPQEGLGGVRSDVNLAIWKAFKEQHIEIPFPHREIRVINPPA